MWITPYAPFGPEFTTRGFGLADLSVANARVFFKVIEGLPLTLMVMVRVTGSLP
jgi:hypothetical protein